MPPRHNQVRAELAREAARLMVEGGIEDYSLAKRKAADRLRVPNARLMPANDEIERAREEYQRLFRAESQPRQLVELRRQALAAMRMLAAFKPRLAGPVLSGTADDNSPVTLHLFAESDEEVAIFLINQRVRHDSGERRLRIGAGEPARLACFSFVAAGIEIELIVFSGRFRRQQPLSPVDGRPMERANLARVQALVDGLRDGQYPAQAGGFTFPPPGGTAVKSGTARVADGGSASQGDGARSKAGHGYEPASARTRARR
ncbi:MAG: hypothetical protein ACR2RL_19545 [Gammaproteobacteria bacterium]